MQRRLTFSDVAELVTWIGILAVMAVAGLSVVVLVVGALIALS